MAQGALFIGQGEVRIQQVKVDASAASFLEGLVGILHG